MCAAFFAAAKRTHNSRFIGADPPNFSCVRGRMGESKEVALTAKVIRKG
jgi:hypothetical protein